MIPNIIWVEELGLTSKFLWNPIVRENHLILFLKDKNQSKFNDLIGFEIVKQQTCTLSCGELSHNIKT
jgi:hypothetical protein